MTDKLRLQVLFDTVDKVTRPLQSIRDNSSQAARTLKATREHLKAMQQDYDRLEKSGMSAHIMLTSQQQNLKKRIDETTEAYNRQSRELEVINEKMRRINVARGDYNNRIAARDKLAGAGAATTATGAAIGLPILAAVREFAGFEDAMLGVARQMEGARDGNGKLTRSYYEMAEAVKTMSERLPGTANDIAAIVEAGARMGIQGKANLLAYAQTTAVMANAFDLPVDEVGENVAKLSQLYKVPIKSIGQLGDVINFLDDNALSKGGDIIEVMQRIAGTAASVNMQYRQAAALGSTFLSLGASAEVAASASNAMMRELSVATMQSARFRDGLKMLKLDAKSIQLGMSSDSTGTIIKVLEAIKALPQAQQLEATTRLFGKEFGDDAAKIAANLGEYHRQLKLVNDERGRGSMQREGEARMQTLSMQYENATDTVRNLSSELGQSLKPALVDIMSSTAEVLRAVRDWTIEHPTLTSAIVKTAAGLALLLTVIGGLMLAAAAVLGPMAALKYSMAILGIKGIGLVSSLRSIGTVFMWLGRLMMANPLGLAITVIAGGAYLIYKNWDALKKWFSSFFGWIGNKAKAMHDMMPAWMQKYTAAGWLTGAASKMASGPGNTPVAASRATSKKLAAAGAGVMIGSAAFAGDIPIDTRPPVSAAKPVQVTHQPTYNMTIQATPGMDEAALAKLVRKELDKRDADNAAKARSRLRDSH